MLNRLFTCFIALALLTVQAQASSQQGLKAAFDELNYALEVRHLDRASAFKTFSERVSALQEQGLTNAELITFTQSQVKNRALAAELGAVFATIQAERLSGEEALDMVRDLVGRTYQSGSSWTGEAGWLLPVGMVLLLLLVLGSTSGETPLCADSEYYEQNPSACDPVVDDFNDPWY